MRAPVPLRPMPTQPAAAPESVTGKTPDGLPRPLTSLVGREAEIASLRALLMEENVRLLTLTGPGGIGKTRLALRLGAEVAEAFPDGVVFVPLAAIADAELVLPTIARALGLREPSERSFLETVIALLQERPLLLILDNIEHLPAAFPLVATL